MTAKTASLYNKVFEKIEELTAPLIEKNITTDFETGLLPVLRTKFRSIIGCFFHYCSNILKWIRVNGYIRHYRKSTNYKRCVRRFLALALLPLEVTTAHFEELVELCPRSMAPFIDYYRRQWLGNVQPCEWNVYNELHRTNNGTEGKLLRVTCSFVQFSYRTGWHNLHNCRLICICTH